MKKQKYRYSVRIYWRKAILDKNNKITHRWVYYYTATKTNSKSHALRIIRIWTNHNHTKATLRLEV